MTKTMQRAVSDSYRTSHASPGYGEHYSKTYEHGYYAYQWQLIEMPLLKTIFAALKNRDQIRHLDFACGTGRILALGEEFFGDTTGVDVSCEMLRVAARNCQKSNLIQQDITRSPLKAEYDVITAFRFFLNAEPELADEVLSAFHKLLPENNGTLFVNIHVNKYSPLGVAYELRNMLSGKKLANTKKYTDLKHALETNGFIVEKIYWYSYFPRIGWRLPRLSKSLMVPIENFFKLIPAFKIFSQSYLVQCRKK